MKNFRLVLFICLVASKYSWGQEITFTVKDKASNLPLDEVQVFSHEKPNNTAFTSKKGVVKFDVRNTDTVVFFKQFYSPVYVKVKREKLDTIRNGVKILMQPNNARARNKSAKYNGNSSLNPNDTIDGGNLEVIKFDEYTKSLPKDKAFHLVDINIDNSSTKRSAGVSE